MEFLFRPHKGERETRKQNMLRAAIAGVALLAWAVVLPGAYARPLPGMFPQAGVTPASPTLQAAPDSRTTEQLLKEASQAFNRQEYEAARSLYGRALERARAEKKLAAEAEARLGLGGILYARGEYPAARVEDEKALLLCESFSDRTCLARAYGSLANVATMMGEPKRARELYEKALAEHEATGNLRGKANTLLNMTFRSELSPEEQENRLRTALEIAQQIGDKDIEARVFHNWGDRLFSQGKFAEALERYESAQQRFEELHDRNRLAGVLTSMGRLQRAHGHPEVALEFYRRALKLQEEIGDRGGGMQSLNAIAVALSRMGELAEACKYTEKALAIARETGSPQNIAFLRGNLAACYLDTGESARAAEILEELTQHGAGLDLENRYSQLALAYLDLGRTADALQTAEKAVSLARARGNVEFLPSPLEHRARAYLAMGQTDKALEDAREALEKIEQLRAQLVPTDYMKRGFGETWQELYSLTIELYEKQGRSRQALEIAEQARARAFLDLLATREVQFRPQDAAELISLRRVQEELKSRGIDPASAEARAAVPLTLRGSSPETGELLKKWHSADPELLSFISASPLSFSQLASTAARLQSTLLSYWVGPRALFIWVVHKDGVIHSARVDVSAQRLAELARSTAVSVNFTRLRGSSSDPSESTPAAQPAQNASPALTLRGGDTLQLGDMQKDAWRELYRLLIRPIRTHLPAARGSLLTVIPHGPLLQVSFAALLDEKDRYLVEDYTLHYAPAGAALQFTERKKHQEPAMGYLLVADPTLPPVPRGEKVLPRLPGTRDEIQAIARLLAPRKVTLLVGDQAEEAAVRGALGNQRVVHFATHGVVREDAPFDSYLALGGRTGDPANDGRLVVQEIYALHLNAELIVLSACRTGAGKVSGDGITGLARAFFYAGTPSLVVTFWDVADEPSRLLLPGFYRFWRAGRSKSQALRAAQLQLLRDLRAGKVKVSTRAGEFALPEHPAFWAGYVLLGEPN